jgi:hypothetical protein
MIDLVVDDPGIVRRVSDLPLTVTCPRCGRTSSHPDEFVYRYCRTCDQYHDDEVPVIVSIGTVTETLGWLTHQPGYLDRLADMFEESARHFRQQAAADRTPRPASDDR